ncbi:MAG: proW [Microbacterium sp.]|nr:proW [Microbacterium sp.]
MDGFRIPVGSWVDAGVDWLRDNLSGFFDVIAVTVRFLTAMQTLALVLVATVVAVAISVPLGIWSARNPTVRAVLKPILDFMQTMPAFVYLIPAITFFSIGVVPGVVSTVIFALPPGVRLTELGIRGVDSETVEAGQAFGATPGQILRGIVEAGLSVVILAVYLDRLTAALGNRADNASSLLAILGRRRAAGSTDATAPRPAPATGAAAEAPEPRTPVSTGA